MKAIWDEKTKKTNITDSDFEQIVIEESGNYLTEDDKDFILASFNSGMYNYVVEYIYNKMTKSLQDAIFSMGNEVIIDIAHWVDRGFISKFFDIFVLRLACDFDLITKQEKIKIVEVIELLQKRKDNISNKEIDKEKAKYLLVTCFNAVIFKDYSPFVEQVKKIIDSFYTVDILPYSDIYNQMIVFANRHKNMIIRIMFSMLKNTREEGKRLRVLCQNVKNLFPYLWDISRTNDKKFVIYLVKNTATDSTINKIFEEVSKNVEFPTPNSDITLINKVLKNCQDVISNHYSVNNHRGEIAPLLRLQEMSNYPTPFTRSVITPCLITYLGNSNGYYNEAREVSVTILDRIEKDRWRNYFKHYFAKDDFVLMNLILATNSIKDWCALMKKISFDETEIPDEDVREFIIASRKQDTEKVTELANKIYFA